MLTNASVKHFRIRFSSWYTLSTLLVPNNQRWNLVLWYFVKTVENLSKLGNSTISNSGQFVGVEETYICTIIYLGFGYLVYELILALLTKHFNNIMKTNNIILILVP